MDDILEHCVMTTDIDIPKDTPVWIEQDGFPGPTDGDTIVEPGAQLEPSDKVQLGYCKEW